MLTTNYICDMERNEIFVNRHPLVDWVLSVLPRNITGLLEWTVALGALLAYFSNSGASRPPIRYSGGKLHLRGDIVRSFLEWGGTGVGTVEDNDYYTMKVSWEGKKLSIQFYQPHTNKEVFHD